MYKTFILDSYLAEKFTKKKFSDVFFDSPFNQSEAPREKGILTSCNSSFLT